MPPRLLLLCLLLRSSWPTVEGERHVGAAGVLHRQGGRAAVAVSVGVAGGVPLEQSRRLRLSTSRLPQVSPKRKPSRACRVGDQEDARGGRDSGEQFPAGSWASV